MTVWRFENFVPQIDESSYIADTADVIGNVKIGKSCYIGPGVRIRGDYGKVIIGDKTAIQENVVIHARPDEEVIIGDNVTVGHGAILHNCVLENFSVVGMGAVVSDYAHLFEWSVIGENGLVKRGQRLGEGEIAVGSPARVIGNIKDREELKEELMNFKIKYVEMAERHLKYGALEKIR
jgi:phenylacetic acid degradation protein